MASIASGYTSNGISIGRIISRGFGIIAANPVASLAIGLTFGGMQTIIRPWLEGLTAGNISGRAITLFFVAAAISTLIKALSYGVFAPAAVTYGCGQSVQRGEWASTVLRALPLMIALAVIYTAAIYVGFILLFVPSTIVAIMWSVAGPALIAERIGVFGALQRSRYLTRGARWHILGLVLVVSVMAALISSIFAVIRVAIGGTGSFTQPVQFSPSVIALSIVTYALTAVLSAAIASALYIDLRDWKDGADPRGLAEIFS